MKLSIERNGGKVSYGFGYEGWPAGWNLHNLYGTRTDWQGATHLFRLGPLALYWGDWWPGKNRKSIVR